MTCTEVALFEFPWDNEPVYDFHKQRYIPELQLNFGDLVAFTGMSYWIEVVGKPDYSVELSDSAHSDMFGTYVHDMLLSSAIFTHAIGKEKVAEVLSQEEYYVNGLAVFRKYL